MFPMTAQQLKRTWPCTMPVSRAGWALVRSFSNTPPYLAPEAPVRALFDAEFGDLGEDAYKAWFETSAYQRVTITFEGEEITGILATSGITGIYNACLLIGGCVDADPCDCVEAWWTNKPLSPCE